MRKQGKKVIINNTSNVDIDVIKSLPYSNIAIIHIMVYQYALDEMDVLLDQIEIIKECFNNSLHIGEGLITAYHKNCCVDNHIFRLQEKGIQVFHLLNERKEN